MVEASYEIKLNAPSEEFMINADVVADSVGDILKGTYHPHGCYNGEFSICVATTKVDVVERVKKACDKEWYGLVVDITKRVGDEAVEEYHIEDGCTRFRYLVWTRWMEC